MIFVYMVECADGTLYTGIAKDPEAREAMHNAGRGAKYTRSRLPVRMVWQQQFASEHLARRAEVLIKQLSRQEKLRLAAGEVVLCDVCPRLFSGD
ncbi:MAG TPA: GIY-YIG nuclease family protein [Candidatus Avidehalobacter gallistercoris]|uniref:GIY-YIG nuclease family protein n=1 Tax=Candidatus Avidehalobacter gallistercoris TaxID=2840694 RepID=A0A9D1HMU6_9FIRM|nr:GIY-YIG nuclease family protein [Candidatus Avidehalobacter gallistercoris]